MSKLYLLVMLLIVIPAWPAQWVFTESRELPLAAMHHPGDAKSARVLINIANDETVRIAKYLQMNTMSGIRIILFTSKGEFMKLNKPDIGLMGVSYGSNTIHILYTEDFNSNKSVLAHELTHSLLAQKLGNKRDSLPIWLNEGIAGYLSDPIAPTALKDVSELIGGTGVLTVEQMEDAFDNRKGNVNAAYVQARSMTAWMEYSHPGALIKVITKISAGSDFNLALKQETGLSVNSWWFWWKSNVPAIEYFINFLNSPAAFAPLAFLVVIVAVIRKLRKRKEDEEEEEEDEKREDEKREERKLEERNFEDVQFEEGDVVDGGKLEERKFEK